MSDSIVILGAARTPILMLSANAGADHRDESRAAGADGHVTKPITADGLLRVVEHVWNNRATRDDEAATAARG